MHIFFSLLNRFCTLVVHIHKKVHPKNSNYFKTTTSFMVYKSLFSKLNAKATQTSYKPRLRFETHRICPQIKAALIKTSKKLFQDSKWRSCPKARDTRKVVRLFNLELNLLQGCKMISISNTCADKIRVAPQEQLVCKITM